MNTHVLSAAALLVLIVFAFGSVDTSDGDRKPNNAPSEAVPGDAGDSQQGMSTESENNEPNNDKASETGILRDVGPGKPHSPLSPLRE